MKTKQLFISLTLGLSLTLALLWLLGGWSTPVAAAPAERPRSDATPIHYVAITSTNSNNCSTPAGACRTIQYAVDKAGTGDEIRVASGVYTGVNSYGGLAQVVYISKTVTIRGGYTTTNWTTPYPITQPTTLDAQRQGRVLYITGNISPAIEGLRITGGDATGLGGVGSWWEDGGGGMYIITATATLSNNWIFSNTAGADDDRPAYGGGLYLRRGDAILSSNTVASNTADYGGGLYLRDSGATLSGNTVISNTAADYGGGLGMWYSEATLSGNTVASNTASMGGGLYLWDNDAVTLTNNTVTSNTASSSGGGGGLYLYGDATLSGNTIASNITTFGDGGGLHVDGGYPMLTDNAIVSNTAAYGGGLYLDGGLATLSGNNVAFNTAGYGGGLYLYRSYDKLSGNTVISNTARWGGGGGLFLSYQSDATLTSNVIANNRALTAGSGLYIEDSRPRLLHTTIARNSGGDGSGVYVTDWCGYYYSTVAMTNTILVSHSVGIRVTAGNTATLAATLWGDGVWANGTDWGGTGTIITGTHNYWGDPAFVDPNAGDYHIGSTSAATDKGVDAGVTDDIDGDPRPQGGGYDLGADELLGAAPGESKIYLPLIMRQYP